jgi:hypothetical protein
MVESGGGLIQITIPHLPGETKETHIKAGQDSRSPDQDLNLKPLENGTGVITRQMPSVPSS